MVFLVVSSVTQLFRRVPKKVENFNTKSLVFTRQRRPLLKRRLIPPSSHEDVPVRLLLATHDAGQSEIVLSEKNNRSRNPGEENCP